MYDLEENKALVRRYFDMFNEARFDELADIVAADYGDKLEGQTAGIDVVRTYLEGLKKSFPDFRWEMERMIAEGDLVAVMNRVTGTQLGEFGDLGPTGRRVSFAAFQFYRIENGKLAEHWEVADFAKMQEQLSQAPEELSFKAFQKRLR